MRISASFSCLLFPEPSFVSDEQRMCADGLQRGLAE
jgi:hypothetical protein